jgi:hypothetical protein
MKYDNILLGYPKNLAGTTLASKSIEAAPMRYVVHVTKHRLLAIASKSRDTFR